MSSATFSQTRSQALNLEKQTESLLSQYSVYQSHTSTEPDAEETATYQSIQDILVKREGIINKLNRISESSDLNSISTSKLQQLTRHKEILNEHRNWFMKMTNNINEERNKNNLLYSVRSDIKAHKKRTENNQSATDYILDERVRVENSNSIADRLLQQAFQTRDELYRQRQYLDNAQSKMMGAISSIPGIGALISKINTRRKRDTLILATVIALCILVLFFL